MTYRTKGTCSMAIHVELDSEHVIQNVEFVGGCSRHTQGVAVLVKGMKAEEAIDKIEGIRCGSKPTSCPDQLAKALRMALEGDGDGSVAK